MTVARADLDIYIQISQIWALVIAVFGGIGNLLTVLAVIHEIYLNYQTKHKRRFINNQMLSLKGKDLRQSSFEENKSNTPLRKLSVCTVNTISSIIQEMSSGKQALHKSVVLNSDLGGPSGKYIRRLSDPCMASTSFAQDKTSCPSTSKQETNKLYSTSKYLTVENNNRSVIYKHNNGKAKVKINIDPIENGIQLTKLQRISSLDILESSSFVNQKSKMFNRKMSLLKCDRGTIIILSLCLTDFLYCVVNLPLTIYTYSLHFNHEHPSDGFCIIATYLRYGIAYAEWLTVGFLFIERCINLKKFTKAKIFSPLQTSLCLMGIWIFSFLILLPSYLLNRLGYNIRTYKCDIVALDRETPSIHKIIFFTGMTLIPCLLVLTGCISIMIQILRNKTNLIKHGMCSKIIEQRRRETHYSIAIVSGLVALFFICIIPVAINDTMNVVKNLISTSTLDDNDYHEVKISIVAYMVYWIQYALNFVVYVVANPCFRIAYKNFYDRIKMLFRIS